MFYVRCSEEGSAGRLTRFVVLISIGTRNLMKAYPVTTPRTLRCSFRSVCLTLDRHNNYKHIYTFQLFNNKVCNSEKGTHYCKINALTDHRRSWSIHGVQVYRISIPSKFAEFSGLVSWCYAHYESEM